MQQLGVQITYMSQVNNSPFFTSESLDRANPGGNGPVARDKQYSLDMRTNVTTKCLIQVNVHLSEGKPAVQALHDANTHLNAAAVRLSKLTKGGK